MPTHRDQATLTGGAGWVHQPKEGSVHSTALFEHLLCAKHCSGSWGQQEPNRPNSCPGGFQQVDDTSFGDRETWDLGRWGGVGS